MKIIIKKAVKENVPLIIDLLEKLYIELGEEKESLKFLNEELINNIVDSNLAQIFIAMRADRTEEVIGVMTLTESQAIYAGGKYGVIDEMYIVPGLRSMNTGEMLVNEAKKIGVEKKWKRIDVTAPTEERWKRTVAFYEKCGFVFTGPKLKFQL